MITRENLIDYIRENWNRVENVVNEALKVESTVEATFGNEKKTYRFVGNGCGIVYLTMPKTTESAKFQKLVNDVYFTYGLPKFKNMFSDDVRKDLENSGIPLAALWSQDIDINRTFYTLCSEFANQNGIKCSVVANLD